MHSTLILVWYPCLFRLSSSKTWLLEALWSYSFAVALARSPGSVVKPSKSVNCMHSSQLWNPWRYVCQLAVCYTPQLSQTLRTCNGRRFEHITIDHPRILGKSDKYLYGLSMKIFNNKKRHSHQGSMDNYRMGFNVKKQSQGENKPLCGKIVRLGLVPSWPIQAAFYTDYLCCRNNLSSSVF